MFHILQEVVVGNKYPSKAHLLLDLSDEVKFLRGELNCLHVLTIGGIYQCLYWLGQDPQSQHDPHTAIKFKTRDTHHMINEVLDPPL